MTMTKTSTLQSVDKTTSRRINEGDRFLCFKTVTYINRPDVLIFKIGKVYKSYHYGRIEDEGGNQFHAFTYDFWSQYLIKLDEDGIDMSHLKDIPLGDKLLIINQLKNITKKFK